MLRSGPDLCGSGCSDLCRSRGSCLLCAGCAVVRAVHELFWALIFLQLFGLSPLTGLLAIAIPYAGIFAKVYAEILEEADPAPLQAMPDGTGVAMIDGKMQDDATWKQAKVISDLADLVAGKDPDLAAAYAG